VSLVETETRADLAEWVESFDITHPVGGDYAWRVWEAYHQQEGRPQWVVIDRDFVLVHGGRIQSEAEDLAASLL
jgi:hypothetical protein